MNAEEFVARIKANFDKGEVALQRGGGSVVQLRLNYFKVKTPKKLGFNVEKIFDVSGGDEIIYVSGTDSKDGLYWQPHEGPGMFTVEELEGKLDAVLEEVFGGSIDADEYVELSSDEKLGRFEEEDPEWSSLGSGLEQLLSELKQGKWVG